VDRTATPLAATASQASGRAAAAHQDAALDSPPATTPEAQPTPQAGPADASQNGPAVQADTWFARAYHGRDTTVDETAADAGLLVREAVGAVARATADGTARGREEAPDKGPAKHAAPSLAAAYGAGRPAVPDLSARVFDLANAAMPQDAAAPATANGEPLEHAIVKSLKLQWNQGIGEARLQLKPEYLGELSVALRVHGSSVTAVLQSDSPAVRAWVEHHQGELRRALEDAGLSLDSLVIDADGHSRDQKEQAAPDERRQQPGRKPVPPGRFEALL
jgi:flagellar hook-length control protein FliK